MYRYYLTQRPPVPGAVPNNPGMEIEDYGIKRYVGGGMHAWGHVDYVDKLKTEVVSQYELVYGGQSDGC